MSVHSTYDFRLNQAYKLFPYPMPNRAQTKIIQNIIAMSDHEQLFLESPTGSGKTIASLSAILSKREPDEKVVVFVRTVSQMEPILREWGRIYDYTDVRDGLAPMILPLLGKARLCKMLKIFKKHSVEVEIPTQSVHMLCKAISCQLHPDEDTTGDYQIKGGAMKLKLMNMKIAGAAKRRSPPIDEIIENLLMQPYCGYYGLRTMTKHATIVVATYPYLKDIMLETLLKAMGVGLDKLHILIDEAHNLVQSSETVVTKDDLLVTKGVVGTSPIITRLLEAMKYNKQISPYEVGSDEMYRTLELILTDANKQTREDLGVTLGMILQPACANVASFLRARNSGKIYSSREQLKIITPTPIDFLKPMAEAKSLVFQSGTFTPIEVYKKLYGFPKGKHLVIQPMRDNQRFATFLSWKGVTSKFTRRGEVLFSNLARAILYSARISPRHLLAVCPSYQFLEEFLPYLNRINESDDRFLFEIVQEQDGLDIQKLANKVAYTTSTMILLGVSGGKISEGVEFVKHGNSLLSTVVFCGLPFKPLSRESMFIRNIIASIASNAEIADKLEQQIPIIRQVRQAFGRAIRSDNDQGALIILDFRAEKLLKNELKLKHYNQIEPLLADLHQFFKNYPTLLDLE